MLRLLLSLLLILCPLLLSAEGRDKTIEREWLFGIGKNNTLDTYLSPYEYTGPALLIRHRSERMARRGKGRVSVAGNYSASGSRLSMAADEGRAWDAQVFAGVAFLYNWQIKEKLRLAIGPLAEAGIGGTYLLRGGNNPAQARLSLNFGLSGLAEYKFHIRKQKLSTRLSLELPLLGAKFSPRYGQSYYEIFELGHSDRNVCCTQPFNAPSARISAGLRFPLWGATVVAGYVGEAQQSRLNGLKYHGWTNSFVIGFVRRIRFIRE